MLRTTLLRGLLRRWIVLSGHHVPRGYATPAAVLSSPLSTLSSISHSSSKSNSFHPLAFMALPLATLLTSEATKSEEAATPTQSSSPDDPKKNNDILPLKEVTQEIRERLKSFRASRFGASREKGGLYPKISVSTNTEEDGNGPLTIQIPVAEGNIVAALGACLGALDRHGQSLSPQIDTENGLKGTLSLMMPGKAGTVTVSQQNHARLATLDLQKVHGFTQADVDAVVDSYLAGWSPAPVTGGSDGRFMIVVPPRSKGEGNGGEGGDSIADLFPGFGENFSKNLRQMVPPEGDMSRSSHEELVSRLRRLGADVYEKSEEGDLDWSCLAGYSRIKEEVEDTVVMALQHSEAYDNIARQTRQRYESNRPRAVLFEGPPGTGKTLTARIIASRTDVPLVFIPTERVLSKWYGESEKNLSKIFEYCQELGGAIIFIDEVDAVAGQRGQSMHEATRRILSVLLQSVEGFKGSNKNVLICATNRKQDLDSALLSRFDVAIRFDLPDDTARKAVFSRYAKHLSEDDLSLLARNTQDYSCRDIKEVCEYTERKWASKMIRGQTQETTPHVKEYLQAVKSRELVFRPGHVRTV